MSIIYIDLIAISNKFVIHPHAHAEQQVIIYLTHQRTMTILPVTCRKSTEHAAHLPAW